MNRVLWLLAGVCTLGLAYFFRCRHVDFERHPLGGFRCSCGECFAEMPTLEHPYVNSLRTTFDRKHLEVTRAGWVN